MTKRNRAYKKEWWRGRTQAYYVDYSVKGSKAILVDIDSNKLQYTIGGLYTNIWCVTLDKYVPETWLQANRHRKKERQAISGGKVI